MSNDSLLWTHTHTLGPDRAAVQSVNGAKSSVTGSVSSPIRCLETSEAVFFRAQPCGPCTRRGEQSKCQWRTLEPVYVKFDVYLHPWHSSPGPRDKYVTRAEYDELKFRTRAEYDELKARLDHLETMVSRIFSAPPGAVNVPLYSMSPDMSSAPPSENISFHAGHASTGSVLYSSAVPPSASYQADHVPKPPQYPSNSPHLVTPGTLSATTPTQPTPGGGGGGGPSHVRHPSMSETKSPTAVRQSPLSLASITSPYNTDAQSKNYHAQTPNLPGGRLRPVLHRDEWKGLATLRCGTRPWQWNSHTRQRRACRTLPWRGRPALPWLSICPDHPGGATENRV